MEGTGDPNLMIMDRPILRQPILIAAFAGWPDAGEVATGALRYLAAKLRAKKLARIEADEFYDFSILRPLVIIEQGSINSVRYPSNDFLYWVNDKGDNDLLLFLGTEPQLRWRKYLSLLLEVVAQYGVARVISFGSLFDAVPHTRMIKVSASTTDESLRDLLRVSGVAMSDYHGPTSIHSVFSVACQAQNIETANLWAHCPLYVRAPANPNGCYALLSRLSALIGLDLNLQDLKSAGEYLDATLSKLLQQNKDMSLYVRKLEEAFEGTSETGEGPQGSTEQIIREVEEFLRKEQKGEKGED